MRSPRRRHDRTCITQLCDACAWPAAVGPQRARQLRKSTTAQLNTERRAPSEQLECELRTAAQPLRSWSGGHGGVPRSWRVGRTREEHASSAGRSSGTSVAGRPAPGLDSGQIAAGWSTCTPATCAPPRHVSGHRIGPTERPESGQKRGRRRCITSRGVNASGLPAASPTPSAELDASYACASSAQPVAYAQPRALSQPGAYAQPRALAQPGANERGHGDAPVAAV